MEVLLWVFVALVAYVVINIPCERYYWNHCRNQWRKQSWEGVIIGKYISEIGVRVRGSGRTTFYIELWHNQTVVIKQDADFLNIKESEYTVRCPLHAAWESVEIGDYVIKKSGNDTAERRAIKAEEAREAIHVLIGRLLHEEEKFRSRGLIGRLLRVGEEAHARTVDALGHIGDERAAPVLIEALRDEAGEVRRKSAQALGRIGHVSAVSALEEALWDKDREVRQEAMQALLQIKLKLLQR